MFYLFSTFLILPIELPSDKIYSHVRKLLPCLNEAIPALVPRGTSLDVYGQVLVADIIYVSYTMFEQTT